MIKNKMNNMEVKKNNRNRIFRYICLCDRASNPEIAYELKMSLPTVTQNTKELLERGLIEEVGEFESTGGRRAKAFSLLANKKLAIGLDITKNHVGFLIANLRGEVLDYERLHFPYKADESYYEELNKRLELFLSKNSIERDKILGIGISFPGIVDLDRQLVSYSHMLGLKALKFNTISDFFEYPCYFVNDANAGAYAEGISRRDRKNFFYLSLSNTVGGAVFADDKLTQGENFRCGEVGHMTILPDGEECYCGQLGCVDVYCSAKKLSDSKNGKLEAFFEALDENDREAQKIWNDYTNYLSIAINNIHMVLDCDIMLGGYVGSFLENHLEDIRLKVVKRNTFSEDGKFIQLCKYKVGAAALGAALKIIEAFISEV